jgi:DNA-binding transcriptional LysR family regulator
MSGQDGRITLWGIEVFVAAAEEGAISSAARRLGVSPSAISQQLSGLEATLGAILLDRSARPLRVTPAGVVFRRHAQTILNAAAEAQAELAQSDLSTLTTLRLGMIEDFDADVTPRLLQALSQDLRGCRFLLETGASHRLMDQLEARALDIVVTADAEPGLQDDSDWREVHPLMSEPFMALTARGAMPGDQPLILYSPRHLMGRRIATHLAQQGIRPAHRFELDSYHAILAMVAGGTGWTILPPLALHHAARFQTRLDMHVLPFAPLERSLSLSARAGVLQQMPAQLAVRLRALVAEQIIGPAIATWPMLDGKLRLLQA